MLHQNTLDAIAALRGRLEHEIDKNPSPKNTYLFGLLDFFVKSTDEDWLIVIGEPYEPMESPYLSPSSLIEDGTSWF